MIQLTRSEFSMAEGLFKQAPYGALAAGTLEGSHPGRVFVDRIPDPHIGLVCTRVGYTFLTGDPCPITAEQIARLFAEDIIPSQIEADQNPEFLLFYHPSGWAQHLLHHLGERKPLLIYKMRHTFPPGAESRLPDWRLRLPAGIIAQPITAGLLSNHPELAEAANLFFGSPDVFLEHSFGICLLHGETLAGVCRAVFIGAGEAEIDIYTAENYRGRGLAALCASAFIEICLGRGLRPVWGCWPENTPSLALAHRLGFVEEPHQPACLWVEDPEWKNRSEG